MRKTNRQLRVASCAARGNFFTRNSKRKTHASSRRRAPGEGTTPKIEWSAYGSPSERRGILLLVVLGLLTLFLFIGTAFIASSNQFRIASKTYSKIDARKDLLQSHEDLLDDVLFQLVRDTTNQNSALRYHSLLRDLYGSTDGIIARVQAGSAYFAGLAPPTPLGDVTARQVLEFKFSTNTYFDLVGNEYRQTTGSVNPKLIFSQPLSLFDNAWNGRVLTFLDGQLAGRSTRIVGYFNNSTTNVVTLRVLNLPGPNGVALSDPTVLNSSRFVINGRPFNGTGVGYDSTAPTGSARLVAPEPVPGQAPQPFALMPNGGFFFAENVANEVLLTSEQITRINLRLATQRPIDFFKIKNSIGMSGLGGSDESYDAADFQNMFLAWTSPQPQETVAAVIPTTIAQEPPSLGSMVLPSFHRPELVNYWARRTTFLTASDPVITSTLGTDPANASLLRKVLLRPNWHDHPEFTGSNPEFAATANAGEKLARMIYGPWDVDNDNDGFRDSVWVDFGAPVMMGPNGKLVKPLAAIMVLDMDGRLNVNAHGTGDVQAPENFNLTLAGNVDSDTVPQGQAFGPAEISLRPVVNNRFGELLRGDVIQGKFYPGRYGSDGEPALSDQYDLSAQLKMQGLPSYVPNTKSLFRSNWGTLPDLRCRYAVGLNDFGQSIVEWNANDFVDKNSDGDFDPGIDAGRLDEDNPYELDLSATGPRGVGTGVDNPYSLGEFERLLRAYDVDAGTLAPRLYELLNGNQTSPNIIDLNNWRTLLTTDSYDTPEPGFQLPDWVVNGADGNATTTNDNYRNVMARGTANLREPVSATFADLLEYRLLLGLYNGAAPRALTPVEQQALKREMQKICAPEMMAGLKLDLNRPLGNGRDDDGNGVVDEPGELEGFVDNNSDGLIEETDGDKGALWSIDDDRAGINASTASSAFELSSFLDDYDRDGDGDVERWERGDFLPDNNSNGIIDAPDGDGSISIVERVILHNFRRQLLARHLYVLAMAVVEPLSNTANKEEYSSRSRKLAQWAINSVDFRDPDNIMTAFEYDAIPFDGWDVDGDIRTSNDLPNWSDNGVDDPTPTDPTATNMLIDRDDPEELANRNGNDDDGDSLIDDADPNEIAERQVVWGMERPEVLMSETLSWHDRATWDGDSISEDSVTDENSDTENDENDAGKVGTGGGDFDTDYDQQVRPQGATFIELYNPWSISPGTSTDTHLLDPNTGNDLGVDLAAVDIVTRHSPVWRIDVRKTVDYKTDNGLARLARYVGGPDHDPDDPDYRVQPQIPDRSIYFTNFDPEQYFGIRSTTKLPRWETEWDDDGVAYYSSITNPNANVDQSDPSYIRNHAVIRPGSYLVVGSGIPVDAGGQPVVPTATPNTNWRYEARIGDKKRTSTDQRHAIVLNPFATEAQPSVTIRDRTGLPLQDQAGFSVSSTADTTSVVLLDSVWFRNINRTGPSVQYEGWEYRRFSVSEPAAGYPEATFGSAWKGSYYNDPNGKYLPQSLDIPLDNQRWGKSSYLSGNIVDGQSILGITSPKWYRKSSATDRSASLEFAKDNELRLTLPEKEAKSVRTIPAFSWLYLQRLANPLLPWNPAPGFPKHRPGEIVNPYMTVDSMATNVTVFNGQENTEKRVQNGAIKDYGNSYAIQTFASLQRGRMNIDDIEALRGRIRDAEGPVGEPSSSSGVPAPDSDTGFRNKAITSAGVLPPSTGPGPSPIANPTFIRDPHENGITGGPPFALVSGNLWGEEQIGLVDKLREDMNSNLKKPLGLWVNRAGITGDGLYKAAVSGSHYFHSLPDCTLGFLNEPFRNESKTGENKKFIPSQPFPWLTWHNRPYANPGELLQVPTFRSSQVLKVFGMSKGLTTGPDPKGFYVENYNGQIRRGTYPPVSLDTSNPTRIDSNISYPPIAVDGPFGHLMNFFRTEKDTSNIDRDITGLYRVLDLVEVSSRYVGTETWLNPATFGDTTTPVTSTTDPRYGLQPPFNRIASRREPGRVNVNTIAAELVWNALFHGDVRPNPNNDTFAGPSDNDFASSRRGYGNVKDPTVLDKDFPSFFANPFRSTGTVEFVPLAKMVRKNGTQILNADTTFFRTDANKADSAPSGIPFCAASTNQSFRNASRNPYFRYSPISRLSSMTTTRSNVFAVWITIGFFEVEEAPTEADFIASNGLTPGPDATALYQRVYPDGYTFTKEDGIDTGEEVRLRQFAIVDRTIPVAFEPGANHNVRETVRLKRKVE